jgi:hypothetical protein
LFPNTWIKSDFRTTSSDRFVAVKNEGQRDFIALTVAAEKFSGEIKTTNDFVVFQLKHPETFTQFLTKPVLISIKRVKWGLYDAVRVEVESTNPDIGLRDTTIFYSTVVNDVSYGISLFCQTSNFPQYKPIMVKSLQRVKMFHRI